MVRQAGGSSYTLAADFRPPLHLKALTALGSLITDAYRSSAEHLESHSFIDRKRNVVHFAP